MPIEIRGIATDTALRARVERQLTALLQRLAVQAVAAQVTFFDENGPKGGLAIRCALTVRVPYRAPVRVERVAETPRLAFDGGFPTLERRLAESVEQARDERRHPKKYYAAKRVRKLG